jgi:hypothetical protein
MKRLALFLILAAGCGGDDFSTAVATGGHGLGGQGGSAASGDGGGGDAGSAGTPSGGAGGQAEGGQGGGAGSTPRPCTDQVALDCSAATLSQCSPAEPPRFSVYVNAAIDQAILNHPTYFDTRFTPPFVGVDYNTYVNVVVDALQGMCGQMSSRWGTAIEVRRDTACAEHYSLVTPEGMVQYADAGSLEETCFEGGPS